MKSMVILLAMLAGPAYAQTTDCNVIGGTLHCNTAPSSPGVNWGAQKTPDFGTAAMQGYAAGQAMRAQREAPAQPYAGQTAVAPVIINPSMPTRRPTARDIYVGCSLLLDGSDVPPMPSGELRPLSGSLCRTLTQYYRKPKPGDPKNMQACPPDSLIDPEHEMAIAYIQFYNENASLVATSIDGPTAFDVALVTKWPCPK